MIALLTFLIRFCSHLLVTPGFRFKDSAVGRNSAEGSYVLLESDDLQICISSEREEITWQIRSLHDPKSRNWFSFDLVASLLGHEVSTGVMDAVNSVLLSENLDSIINLFSREEVTETLTKLGELKAKRAKLIFGMKPRANQ